MDRTVWKPLLGAGVRSPSADGRVPPRSRGLSSRAASFLVAATLAACGAPEEPAVPVGDTATDPTEEVRAFVDSFQGAMASRDTARLRSMYVPDGRFLWIEDGAAQYRSPDAVLAALTAFPEGTVITTRYDSLSLGLLGERGAWVTARFSTVFGEGEAAFAFGGMLSFVLERGAVGWQIVGGHTSTTRDGAR